MRETNERAREAIDVIVFIGAGVVNVWGIGSIREGGRKRGGRVVQE